MIILVSDTSILIDLERGGLLEGAFSCGLTMVVPDLLYERELEPENGPFLRKLGLGVVALTPEEVAFAQQLRADRRALWASPSFPDTSNDMMCSGDRHDKNPKELHGRV
ncbi:MAG: hypothetical protein ACN4F8_09100, partial [Hydrogenophaga sp.]